MRFSTSQLMSHCILLFLPVLLLFLTKPILHSVHAVPYLVLDSDHPTKCLEVEFPKETFLDIHYSILMENVRQEQHIPAAEEKEKNPWLRVSMTQMSMAGDEPEDDAEYYYYDPEEENTKESSHVRSSPNQKKKKEMVHFISEHEKGTLEYQSHAEGRVRICLSLPHTSSSHTHADLPRMVAVQVTERVDLQVEEGLLDPSRPTLTQDNSSSITDPLYFPPVDLVLMSEEERKQFLKKQNVLKHEVMGHERFGDKERIMEQLRQNAENVMNRMKQNVGHSLDGKDRHDHLHHHDHDPRHHHIQQQQQHGHKHGHEIHPHPLPKHEGIVPDRQILQQHQQNQFFAHQHVSDMEKILLKLIEQSEVLLTSMDLVKEEEKNYQRRSREMNAASRWWPMIHLFVLFCTGITQANHVVKFFKMKYIL